MARASDNGAPAGPVGGLLLVRARADQVTSWVGKGLVSAHVTPLGDWTAVTPAGDHAATAAPYDDARTTLANGNVNMEMRRKVDASSQIRTRLSASGVADVQQINTRGYIDTRGK